MTNKQASKGRIVAAVSRTSLIACLVAISYASASAQTIAYYRFEEGAGLDVVDSESSTNHGTLTEGVTFSDDVPCLDVANQFSADFTAGGWAIMDGTSFIFHAPEAGGAAGDATLEWFFKLPAPHEHASIFWTNADDDASNANRFNIFWNSSFTGAPSSEIFVAGDVTNEDASASQVVAQFNNGVPLVVGVWHHVAIVREANGNGGHDWTWYVDGLVSAGHSATTTLDLPTATTWYLSGRQSSPSYNFRALIDEVRLTAGALEPEDFLACPPEACPPDGDTHCVEITADPPGGDAGRYTVTATATDDSLDPVLYSFTADNGFDLPKTYGPQPANTAAFNLGLGTWTISVTVDDDPLCDDTAVDATCSSINIDVTTVAPVAPVYLRFEEGTGIDVVDSESSAVVGTLKGNAGFSEDTPCLVGGDDNLFSADFTLDGFAEITDAAFLLHDVAGGGPAGDATLEWFFKVPAPHDHASIFWTNAEDSNNDNRFNIYWNTGTGGLDSDRFISGDYDDPYNSGGVAISNHSNGLALSLEEWHHIALVRTANGGGSYSWQWYVDGSLSEGHGMNTTNRQLPDSRAWFICGRQGGHSLGALIDEVRLTPSALTPGQFLFIPCAGPEGSQLAGDCNQDGAVDLSDVVCLLGHLFQGNPEDLPCGTDTANLGLMDCNQDGGTDLSDAIYKLAFLFQGGPPPDLGTACFGIPDCPQNPACP